MLSPDPRQSEPLSGRKSTYLAVQILRATSEEGLRVFPSEVLSDGGGVIDTKPECYEVGAVGHCRLLQFFGHLGEVLVSQRQFVFASF
jgi:hypothetical protein